MKITVITVCKNSALTLERALSSVAQQNWGSIEHIVIDGGSSDSTFEILKRYSKNLTHVLSGPDNGIYDAMNKGISLSSGDVICFLNADDYYASESSLSLVAQRMEKFSLDALMGDVYFFSKSNPKRITRRYRSNYFSPKRLAWGWMPAHPSLFLRREVVKRVGKFDDSYKIAGDFEFIVRVFLNQNLKFQHVPKVLVCMQSGGISTNGWRSKLILNREVLRACRENGLRTNFFKILSKYPFKLLEFIFP